jgi:hypothetical protein
MGGSDDPIQEMRSMLEDTLLNPFEIDPVNELPHVAAPVANWTEYVYFFGYDDQARQGISVHVGREPTDTQIWRGTLGIFLPDADRLLVAKYVGRDGSDRGPGSGPLQVRCITPMRTWMVEFNGLVHPTSRSDIMTKVFEDSKAELAKFCLVFEAAAPFWDLERGTAQGTGQPNLVLDEETSETKRSQLKTAHWEQICRVSGEITFRGKTTRIEGGGVRDHSHGPRDYGPIVGSNWINALFPSGKAIMAMGMRLVGREINLGYIFRNDGSPLEVVKLIEQPFSVAEDTPARSLAADPLTDPKSKHFRFVLQSKKGREVIEGEILHAMGTTYVSPNHELVGTNLSLIKGGSQLAECPALFHWDGETGVGVRERIARIGALR